MKRVGQEGFRKEKWTNEKVGGRAGNQEAEKVSWR